MSEGGRREEWGDLDWEGSVDLTALSEDELRANLEEIVEEERAISCRRQVLHRKIDLIRAELARRGGLSLSPEELARVLMDSTGEERPG
ncbi:MAG: hypothetical protein M3157_05490 [Actinomycetota bacterium]|nr:hypothetical protein [Actinomycetota bacterium]